jgi:hypothetical protein
VLNWFGGYIKNRLTQECMSIDLKEMQTFCKKYWWKQNKNDKAAVLAWLNKWSTWEYGFSLRREHRL